MLLLHMGRGSDSQATADRLHKGGCCGRWSCRRNGTTVCWKFRQKKYKVISNSKSQSWMFISYHMEVASCLLLHSLKQSQAIKEKMSWSIIIILREPQTRGL